MNYPEQIVLEGEDLEFWVAHSGVISDLAGDDDELVIYRSYLDIVGPGTERVNQGIKPKESSELYWSFFVDLVEGNKVASFDKKGHSLLEIRKGYTKKRLLRLLDYLAFPKDKASIEALKEYINRKMLNFPRKTIPRGVGIRKPGIVSYKGDKWSRKYRSYYKNRFVNNNNNNNSENDDEENLDEYKNNNDNIRHLLPVGKYIPYAKTNKKRKTVKRKHTGLTKKMKPRNMKGAKTLRVSREKNRKTNYWTNNMNYNSEEANSIND